MDSIDAIVTNFETALLQINRVKAAGIFDDCLSQGNGFALLETLVIRSLERIGSNWENGSVSLSQVYMSGIICEELIDSYMPRFNIQRKNNSKLAIGVLQDNHALGKRIVYSILRASGSNIVDFGHGLSVSALVQKTIENNIDILLISTLMLPSALKVREVRELLSSEGASTKIIVGGAPFRLDTNLWRIVGADAYGNNASSAIEIIEEMVRSSE